MCCVLRAPACLPTVLLPLRACPSLPFSSTVYPAPYTCHPRSTGSVLYSTYRERMLPCVRGIDDDTMESFLCFQPAHRRPIPAQQYIVALLTLGMVASEYLIVLRLFCTWRRGHEQPHHHPMCSVSCRGMKEPLPVEVKLGSNSVRLTREGWTLGEPYPSGFEICFVSRGHRDYGMKRGHCYGLVYSQTENLLCSKNLYHRDKEIATPKTTMGGASLFKDATE